MFPFLASSIHLCKHIHQFNSPHWERICMVWFTAIGQNGWAGMTNSIPIKGHKHRSPWVFCSVFKEILTLFTSFLFLLIGTCLVPVFEQICVLIAPILLEQCQTVWSFILKLFWAINYLWCKKSSDLQAVFFHLFMSKYKHAEWGT